MEREGESEGSVQMADQHHHNVTGQYHRDAVQPYHIEVTVPSPAPMFDGTKNPQDFITQFEDWFEQYGKKKDGPEGIVKSFGQCMRGDAKQWYSYQVSYGSCPWDILTQNFLDRFGVASSKRTLIQGLHTMIIRREESVASFVERFHTYLTKCQQMEVQTPTDYVVEFFVLGLKPLYKVYKKLYKLQLAGQLDSFHKASSIAIEISKTLALMPEDDNKVYTPQHFTHEWENEREGEIYAVQSEKKEKKVRFEEEIKKEVAKATDRLETGMQTLLEISKQLTEALKVQAANATISTCTFCQRMGHTEATCFARPCPNCNIRGHYGKECPVCAFCKEIGHTEEKCRVKQYLSKQDMLKNKGASTSSSANINLIEQNADGEQEDEVLNVVTRQQSRAQHCEMPNCEVSKCRHVQSENTVVPVAKHAKSLPKSSSKMAESAAEITLGHLRNNLPIAPKKTEETEGPHDLERLLKGSSVRMDLLTLLKVAPSYKQKLMDLMEQNGESCVNNMENVDEECLVSAIIVNEVAVDPGIFECGATVKGKQLERVYVDGGSGSNVMPYNVMMDLGLKVNRSTMQILRTFSGHKVRPIGIVTDVPVIVEDITVVANFVVVPSYDDPGKPTSYDLLLGRRWMKSVDARPVWGGGYCSNTNGTKVSYIYNNEGKKKNDEENNEEAFFIGTEDLLLDEGMGQFILNAEVTPMTTSNNIDNYSLVKQEAVVQEDGSEKHAYLWFDGGISRKLQLACTGVVLKNNKMEVLEERGEIIHGCTSNAAEYKALLAGLIMAQEHNVTHLHIKGDSQLVCSQILGDYRVRNECLSQLWNEAHAKLAGFMFWEICHVPREQNSEADALCKNTLFNYLCEGAIKEEDIDEEDSEKLYPILVVDVAREEQISDIIILKNGHERKVALGTLANAQEKDELAQLFQEHSDVFAYDYSEMKGVSKEICEFEIKLKPEAKPVLQKLRRINPALLMLVQQEIQKMLEAGLIYEIQNPPWVSCIVPVLKKNGKLRICIDYQELNKATLKDCYPLPFLEDILHTVAGKEVYSFMDGFSGFNQVYIKEEDQPKTSFITPWGTYAMRRMPFGLMNAPAAFQRVMCRVFKDIPAEVLRIFLDDLCLATARSQYLGQLRHVFELCKKFEVCLNPYKRVFLTDRGVLLGHEVSKEGITIAEDKMKALRIMAPPKNLKAVKGLIGMVSFLRMHIPNMSHILSPIAKLTRRGHVPKGRSRFMEIEWTKDCDAAWSKIKEIMSNKQLLVPPKQDHPFSAYITVTRWAVGIALCQQGGMVMYAGKQWSLAEEKYPKLEKYAAALKTLVDKCGHYFSNSTITVYMKQNPLSLLYGKSHKKAKLHKWAVILQEYHLQVKLYDGARDPSKYLPYAFYDYDLEEKVGAEQVQTDLEDCVESYVHFQSVWIEQISSELFVDDQRSWMHDIIIYLRDQELPKDKSPKALRRFKLNCLSFVLVGDILCRKTMDGILLRCLDEEEQAVAMAHCHEGICGGHMAGRMTSKKVLRAGYFWPTLHRDCQEYVKHCHACQAFAAAKFYPGELVPIEADGPFQMWGLDYIGPIDPHSSAQHEYILVATDLFTKWAEAVPLRKATAENTAGFIFTHLCCRFGIPRKILTDRGTHFINSVIQELVAKLHIKHLKSSSYYPEGNGQAESSNKVLTRILKKTVKETGRDWHIKLDTALWAYRTAWKSATGFSPFNLVYGTEALLPIDIELPTLKYAMEMQIGEPDPLKDRFEHIMQLEEDRWMAEMNMQIKRTKDKVYFQRKQLLQSGFEEGELVMKWNREKHVKKFQPPWEGPYIIAKKAGEHSYWLQRMDLEMFPNPINLKYLKKYWS